MSRLALVGDTHCDISAIEAAVSFARQNDCQEIIVLGDFGYWPSWSTGEKFIWDTSQMMRDARMKLSFLRGNHEDIEALNALEREEGFGEIIEIGPYLRYLSQGSFFTMGSKTFGVLGGAYSIDSSHRTEGVDWFPNETIQYRDVNLAMSIGSVDVLLTHDAPLEADPLNGLNDVYPESQKNRQAISHVIDVLKPNLLFHGHYHHRYTQQVGNLKVVGLNCDGKPGSMVLYDTELGTWHDDWM